MRRERAYQDRAEMKRTKISDKTRNDVIVRDDFSCRYCGKRSLYVKRLGPHIHNVYMKSPAYHTKSLYEFYDPEPFDIDHIIPLVSGGSSLEANLALSCRSCNRSKGVSRAMV